MNFKKRVGGVIMGSLVASALFAAEVPKVGGKAPDFTLDTIDGGKVRLSDVNKDSKVVLLVLRGWPGYQCPLCTVQVHEFTEQASGLKAKGAKVIMVYPGPADGLKAHADEFLKDKAWPKEYVFALDPSFTMVNAYGLRWEADGETSYPSTFVLSPKGTVDFAKVSHGHGDRAKAAEVLAALGKTSTR